MRHKDVQKCIQMYNSLCCVFTHYEKIYHKSWFDNLEKVRSALGAPIILPHPHTKKYVVNFDPFLPESIREIECMLKLDLEVPDTAKVLNFCKDKINYAFQKIKALVKENDNARLTIHMLFLPLMRPTLTILENAFMPGMSGITWTSSEIPSYFEKIETALKDFKRFIKEVIVNFRSSFFWK